MACKRLYILILTFICCLAGTARAQLFLEEGKVVLGVSAGERLNKSLVVHNTTKEEVDVRLYWEDFEYKPPYEGAKDFVPAGSSKYSASQWISYVPQTFKIPPFGKQQIDYTVSVPDQINGGHYGVLFFEKAGDPIKAENGLSIITRVGCLFFVEPKDKSKKAEVADIAVKGNTVTGTFVNQGNVILIPRMTYNIMDKEGLVDDRGEIKQHYVPPGRFASWEIVLPKALKSGEHTLLLNTDLEEGDVVVKEVQLSRDEAGNVKIVNVRD